MDSENKLFSNWPAVSKNEWIAQMQIDLKGNSFEEKLISEYSNIKVYPAYTAGDLPGTVTDASDEFNEEDFEADDAQLMTWSVCREIIYHTDTDIYSLADAELNHGALCVRVSGDVKSFLQQFRLVRPEANHFIISVDDDLSDHDSVILYRNLINNIGGHQLLISAIEFDPIGFWMKSGSISNKENSFQHLAEIYFRLSPVLHDCKIILVDASIAAEAGANIIQQLAYALSIAEQYLIEMNKRNVPLDDFIQLFNFRFSVQSEYFFEIAKLRAFKRLWINLIKGFIPEATFIPEPHIHAVTSKVNLTSIDNYNNMLRATTEAMSAVLGGCQILSVNTFSANTDQNDDKAERLALNIQHMLRYESGFDAYSQMADGSYYIESLTTTIAEKAWNHFQQISSAGGFVACLEKGIIQNEINITCQKIIDAFNLGENKIIGVNIFRNNEDEFKKIQHQTNKNSTAFPPVLPFQLNP